MTVTKNLYVNSEFLRQLLQGILGPVKDEEICAIRYDYVIELFKKSQLTEFIKLQRLLLNDMLSEWGRKSMKRSTQYEHAR